MPKLRINLTNLNAQSSQQNAAPVTLPHSGLEEQFILRLPPSLASILNSELAENEYTSPGDLSIKFLSSRTAIVKHPRFIKDAYPAVLVDSPTVMETLKSSNLSVVGISGSEEKDEEEAEGEENNSNEIKNHSETEINVGQYYKVADLNQILMVLDLDTTEGQRVINRVPQALQEQLLKSLQNNGSISPIPAGLDDVTASWAQWPDGLTFPMKSVKQKKFAPRPLHASTVGDFERIEREVERLLKSDGQAIESKFTLIGSTGEVLLGDLDVKAGLESEDVEMFNEAEEEQTGDEEPEFEEEEEPEEEVSSASDIEDMNDFAAEIEDNLLAEEHETEQATEPEPEPESSPVESETDRLVKDLEAKLAEKQKQAETVSNPLIKARIEDVIRQMEDNLRNLRETK
jgi:TATA-binding protein-associated factor Taf7